MTKKKELLFSITSNDCKWTYTKGSGAGGQKRNKTSSAVYCKHEPSGAQGYAEDHREQRLNKELAFERMAKQEEFKKWHYIEIQRRTGQLEIIKQNVEQQMHPKNIKVDVKDEKGRWVDEKEIVVDDGE